VYPCFELPKDEERMKELDLNKFICKDDYIICYYTKECYERNYKKYF
jgi:hypothetical protein